MYQNQPVERMLSNSLPNFGILRKKDTGSSASCLPAAMAAANEVARVMAEAAALVQETWKDMAGGPGAPKLLEPLFRGTIFL